MSSSHEAAWSRVRRRASRTFVPHPVRACPGIDFAFGQVPPCDQPNEYVAKFKGTNGSDGE